MLFQPLDLPEYIYWQNFDIKWNKASLKFIQTELFLSLHPHHLASLVFYLCIIGCTNKLGLSKSVLAEAILLQMICNKT